MSLFNYEGSVLANHVADHCMSVVTKGLIQGLLAQVVFGPRCPFNYFLTKLVKGVVDLYTLSFARI
jgi:hypothetical protein